MEKVATFKTLGKELRILDDIAIVFNKNRKTIQKINLKTGLSTSFFSKTPITALEVRNDKIFVFQKAKIEIFTFEQKVLTLVLPHIEIFFDFPNETRLFLRKNELILYTENLIPKVSSFLNYQHCNDILLLNYESFIEIYRDNVGLIYSKSKAELNQEFNCDVTNFTSISIRNGKVYFLLKSSLNKDSCNGGSNGVSKKEDSKDSIIGSNTDNIIEKNSIDSMATFSYKIVGPDLNVYLDDFIAEPIKFQNIENGLIILNKNSTIFIVNKNLSTKLIASGNDFTYNEGSKRISIIDGNDLNIFEETENKVGDFKLIEENVIYSECEDEFDISNDNLRMF